MICYRKVKNAQFERFGQLATRLLFVVINARSGQSRFCNSIHACLCQVHDIMTLYSKFSLEDLLRLQVVSELLY